MVSPKQPRFWIISLHVQTTQQQILLSTPRYEFITDKYEQQASPRSLEASVINSTSAAFHPSNWITR